MGLGSWNSIATNLWPGPKQTTLASAWGRGEKGKYKGYRGAGTIEYRGSWWDTAQVE